MSEHGIVLSLASTKKKSKNLFVTVGLVTKNRVFTKKNRGQRSDVFPWKRTQQNFSKISSEHT